MSLITMPTIRPARDVRRALQKAATALTREEARYLVDAYYQMQKSRIETTNRISAAERGDQPPMEVLEWLAEQLNILENEVKRQLKAFANATTVGRWAMSICGVGPVISAGLLAHIDIEQAPTVGHIWAFAGLDPTRKWEKGQKRPYNAHLKTLCWKIGESFVKVSGNEKDIYGKVYLRRKEYERRRNDNGEYANQAAAILERKPNHKQAAIYRQGKLPDGHIHARAKRYAVKLFLAHWHHVAYEVRYGTPPPKPYILEHGKHADFIAPPNWPME